MDMVKAIKKAGWVRSALTVLIMLCGLVGAVWTAHGHISGTAKSIVEEKIQLHEVESELRVEQQLGEIRTEQRVMDTKLDLLLGAQGIEVPRDQ